MWIYEVDRQYIEPQLVDTVQLWAGERYSAVIKLDNTPGDYTIQVVDQGVTQIIWEFAILRYKGGTYIDPPIGYLDYNGQNLLPNMTTLDKKRLPLFPSLVPSATADETHVLFLGKWNEV